MGVSWLIFDEAAFIENGRDVYASALPTVSTGGHILLVSTPNGKDTLYYETCRRAKQKGTSEWNGFELVEMKWYQDPRYNKFLEWTKKDEETGEVLVEKEPTLDKDGNIKYDEEHWEQMINDGWKPRSPWYIRMCRQFNNDSQKIAQELDVSFLGSASNVVEPEFIEMQSKLNVRDPLYMDPMIDDVWIWKEPIPGHRYVCAVDNSRGDASDRTAIEMLDLDGVDDETGEPILEQVMEYQGKMTGDDVGELVFKYANMYNQAFVVVECIGGVGDSTVLLLQRLEYKNMYYDDPELKTYTMQREASGLKVTNDGKLPGFHSSSVRFQMLTNFANMVKTNQIKIRSRRVISELDTWIYKGAAARIDHQDGAHDDTLTCLAMGVFVIKFSLNKLMATQAKDKAMLRAWVNTSTMTGESETHKYTYTKTESMTMEPKPKKNYQMPFYTGEKSKTDKFGPYMWLIR